MAGHLPKQKSKCKTQWHEKQHMQKNLEYIKTKIAGSDAENNVLAQNNHPPYLKVNNLVIP